MSLREEVSSARSTLEAVLKKLIGAALVLSVMAFVAPVLAQAQMTVSGIATDAGGSVLANVEIRVVAADGSEHTARTNSMGEWSVANVPPGALTVSLVGLETLLSVAAGGAVTGLVVASAASGLSAAAIAAIAAAVAAGVAGGVAVARNDDS
jgi:hypothetical protein